MSNLTFRPRPINVNRKMPIVKHETDFEVEPTISRSVPQMPTGMDPEDAAERHIRDAMARVYRPNVKFSEIPTPTFRTVPGYESNPENPFIQPNTYIRFKTKSVSDLSRITEYDLEPCDEEFLDTYNKHSSKIMDANTLEIIIDRIEKARCQNKYKMLPLSAIKKMLSKHLDPDFIEGVYAYWDQKVEKSSTHFFIPRFQRTPAFSDPSPFVAFRPREKEPRQRKARTNNKTAYKLSLIHISEPTRPY
eukprot:TRINITY_DN3321_c0_g1_i2.p1 TRINITY_DN3321_c0_g1~~TRINITY_DN3321_c0_g1_i2.p1  ORF type:complete len:248 (-),score=14.40 TRINITY_DN3321_c0_g1_i2:18-761(-)